MKNKKILVLISGIILIGAFAAASIFYRRSENKKLDFIAQKNAQAFVRDHSVRMGAKEPKVYVIEFLDPECESCRAFYPTIKRIMNDYKNDAALVIRYAPFHKNSKYAVQVLEAVRKQGLYWDALEAMFEYQPIWADHHNPQPEKIWEIIEKVGVKIERAKAEMNDPEIAKLIEQDVKDAQDVVVQGTPTFFVNGNRILRLGEDYIRQSIDEQIALTKK